MASNTIDNVNQVIDQRSYLVSFLNSDEAEGELKKLNIDWSRGEIYTECPAANVLLQEGMVQQEKFLNRKGFLFLSRMCIDFENSFKIGSFVCEKYEIKSLLKVGKNSATFLASHIVLQNDVVLKIIRPGASSEIVESLRLLSSKDLDERIVKPIDYLHIEICDIFEHSLSVHCVVFPFIKGETFRQFLSDSTKPTSSHIVVSFLKQIGSALASLEKIGAYHGDFHDENIIVNYDKSSVLSFNIIDVSYNAVGSLGDKECKDNDLTFFRQHLWKILSIQQNYLEKMSIRKHLGSRVFSMISTVMSSSVSSFQDVTSLNASEREYKAFIREKNKFLENKFTPPSFFRLQRYEEITDPTVALELFVPFPELMDKVSEFANTFIAGNRGSGKSTYLAALGFFPKTRNNYVDFKNTFGVYFPCRMGEFRLLSPGFYKSNSLSSSKLKQVLIVKIVRRTLEILTEAVELNRLTRVLDYTSLKISLERITKGNKILNLDQSVVSEIRNITSTVMRFEMKEIEELYGKSTPEEVQNVVTEIDLLNFFNSVRSTYSELAITQFHLLFDDAGQPHLPAEVQNVLNDLILSSNPVYCIKFSAEKLTYTFKCTSDKVIENGHDYFEYNISALLFIGSKSLGLRHFELEKYFRKIVEKRLKHFSYSSHDIHDYLGDDEVKSAQLINSLATGRRNAYYFGWTLVWKIADRTPRNLLELVGEIFSAAGITRLSPAEPITARTQDRAFRIVSEKRLHSLSHISGVISVNGKDLSVGGVLFGVASSIGSAFRIYLREERGKKRKRQTLAIERNDTSVLNTEAQGVLNKLITYGVLDDTKLDYARDDRVKKPIYVLNRIYCPAFAISPQRDNHLRLSVKKFENLLLTPNIFMKQGTEKLRISEQGDPPMLDLFGELDD